jgi:hypothetical protein
MKNVETMYESGTYYFHLLKIPQKERLYMALLKKILQLCSNIQHQHCWHMVVHMLTLLTVSYGSNLCITHKCNNINNDIVSKHGTPEILYQEQDVSTFCCARHKELCSEIEGRVMSCSECQQKMSASDIVNQSLQQFKDHLIPGE